MIHDETVQRYVRALFPLAFLLVLVPLGDVALRMLSTEAGSLQWRFGITGLFFGNLGTVTLGLGLAGFAAVMTGSRGVLRGVGVAAFLLVVVLLALLVLFALDAVQMRKLVAIPLKRQVLLSAAGAAMSAVLATIALVVLGRGALVTSRTDRSAARRPKAAPLVAQAPTAAPAVAAPAAPAASRPRAGEPV